MSHDDGMRPPGKTSEFRKDLGDAFFHLFARLEFHHGSGGDWHGGFRLVWIPADFRLGLGHLKGSEIPEDDIVVGRQRGGYFFDEGLHDGKDFLLGKSCFIADPDHEIPLGDGGHGCVVQGSGGLLWAGSGLSQSIFVRVHDGASVVETAGACPFSERTCAEGITLEW